MHRRGGQAGGLAQVRVAHPAVLKEQLNDALVEILHKAQTYCPGGRIADPACRGRADSSAGGMCRANVAKDTGECITVRRTAGL
ncbi:hypothetical protein GCM10010193_44760 [Kitasatospora atroaurantiaca]